jgi:hypothetical protein
MPATAYKIWTIGAPVGIGAMQSLHVGVAGVAKAAAPAIPYAVSNELICGYLARAILLPVPPGFLINKGGVPYHVSLNFNLAGQELPPADAAAVVAAHPRLSWGIILFDSWVVNFDRHNGNIAFDQGSNKVQVFDHSHAFCHTDLQGHLNANVAGLGIGGHCLATEVTTADGFNEWLHRIMSVPEFYIREVVVSSVSAGLPPTEVQFCTDYLLNRRAQLRNIFLANRAAFPKLAASAAF